MATPAEAGNRLRVGLLFETQADAEAQMVSDGRKDLSLYYHWREPFELDAVQTALEAAGHEVVRIGTPQEMARDIPRWQRDIDMVFNMSVGFTDRFRLAAGPMLCELAGIPYSGADPYTKLISQNKHVLKAMFGQLGVATPAHVVAPVGQPPDPGSVPEYPCMVKPVAEGSSVGVWPESVVHSFAELQEALTRLWATVEMDALIESFIAGREIKVVLIGDDEIHFEGIIEDVDADGEPLGNRILHFDSKSTGTMGKRAVPATAPGMDRVLADCRLIYRRFLPVDYASFDLRIADGQHWFLEFQADATLHPKRTLARCCELNGLRHDEAIQLIFATARSRHGV